MSGRGSAGGALQACGCVCFDCLPLLGPRDKSSDGGDSGRSEARRTEATRVVSGHRRRRVLSQEGGRRAQRGETLLAAKRGVIVLNPHSRY